MQKEPRKKTTAQSAAKQLAVSKDGYEFNPASRSWKLNKDVCVSLARVEKLPDDCQVGFRRTLQRYAEEMSPRFTHNLAMRFDGYLRDTGAVGITSKDLLNWRAMLGEANEWQVAALRGFLVAWHEYGFPGVPTDAVALLKGWRLKGNQKGAAVKSGCPNSGPYTDIEMGAILDWANSAVVSKIISFEIYAYLMTLMMTARRPIQIASLRGKDLIGNDNDGYQLSIPRAKQRGGGFRKSFRKIAVLEDLFIVLSEQHRRSVQIVEGSIGSSVCAEIRVETPVFLNVHKARRISCERDIRKALLGNRPDQLHQRTERLIGYLRKCGRDSTARSERTGKRIRLSATRFRHTRGTKLRREGYGAFVIAELLDHSDIQSVSIYTQNTAQEAAVIDALVGSRLAPLAQACMGTLVASERDAIRGEEPTSRVPNQNQEAVGTCGNYGFCASGYRACYTCVFFQAWIDGPHRDVLADLYKEKADLTSAGCSREVVNATDRLILAVENCAALCDEAKKSRASAEETQKDE